MRGPPFLVGAIWHRSGQMALVGYSVLTLSGARTSRGGWEYRRLFSVAPFVSSPPVQREASVLKVKGELVELRVPHLCSTSAVGCQGVALRIK